MISRFCQPFNGVFFGLRRSVRRVALKEGERVEFEVQEVTRVTGRSFKGQRYDIML